MTTEHDAGTRIVLSWLREDAHEDAERVLLRALDEVEATPQRRSWWPAWRFNQMHAAVRLAMGAAVAIAAVILASNLAPTGPGPGGTAPPSATPAPASPTPAGPASPTSAASQTARPLEFDALEPGTYFVRPFGPPLASVTITFTVDEGWTGYEVGFYRTTGSSGPRGSGGAFQVIERLYSDPCDAGSRGDVEVGPTVDDLVTAFQAQTAYETGAPADVVIDGHAGKRIDLLLPSDKPFTLCTNSQFIPWEGGPNAQGLGNRWHLWVLDIGRERAVVVMTQDFDGTPTTDQAALQAIVDSVQIEP